MNKFEELLVRTKESGLPDGKWAIFGSGPIAIRGLKEPHDLDIIVTRDVYDEFKQKSGWTEKQCNQDLYLENEGIELWYNWRPGEWNIEELIKDAEIIEELPFVKLETVLKWKKAMARPKDLEDVKRIEGYLHVQRSNN